MKTTSPFFFAAALAYLGASSAYAEDNKDYVGAKVIGIHDSNGSDILSPGVFIRFDPLYIDAEFGADVWELRLREYLAAGSFALNFDIRAGKNDLGGGLSANVPFGKMYAMRGVGWFGSEGENELYFITGIGGDFVYAPTKQRFSIDVFRDFGRKHGTMLVMSTFQRMNEWEIEQGTRLTSFGDSGFFLKIHYRRFFAEIAHYDNYEYRGFDRTRAGVGARFNF